MAEPRDYLNLSELRELAEIDGDRAKLRDALRDLRMRKQKIKARAAVRFEQARIAVARIAPGGPNAERNAEILRRRQAGEWPTQIAQAMGVGRNVVLGVCYRAGLSDSDTDQSEVMTLFSARGEVKNPQLTDELVRAIRQDYRPRVAGHRAQDIATRFGVSIWTVYNIASGRAWRHVA